MDLLTNNTFGLFVMIVAPGFISMKIWGLIHPSRHISFADSLYEAIFYGSCPAHAELADLKGGL